MGNGNGGIGSRLLSNLDSSPQRNQKEQDISGAYTCTTNTISNVQETNCLIRKTEVILNLSTVFPTYDMPIKGKGLVELSCRKKCCYQWDVAVKLEVNGQNNKGSTAWGHTTFRGENTQQQPVTIH
jgi:hypothetical protein